MIVEQERAIDEYLLLYFYPLCVNDDPNGIVDDSLKVSDDLILVIGDPSFWLICPRRVSLHPYWLYINPFRLSVCPFCCIDYLLHCFVAKLFFQ